MFSSTLITTIASSLLYLASSATAFDINSQDTIALYWGQNSAGSQERLSYYCDEGTADIFLLSFMTTFSSSDSLPALNFASACSSSFDDGLLKCDEIAADIQTCQNSGKKILLSLGGASGSYGFASDSAAEGFAGTLWNMFGGGSADERPFGDAVLDGFDFDIESGDSTGYAALATKLREYYAEDTSKDYYISAAPQCVYPDASVGDLLANADVDFAFIQFYNNDCNVDKNFNWDTWADFASGTSPNSNIKLFLGLPGSSSGAGSGYVDVDTVKSSALSVIAESSSNFGGIMLWDASQGYANEVNGEAYVKAMKGLLTSGFGSGSSSTEASSSTTTTQVATTSTLSSSVETSIIETSSAPGETTTSSVWASETTSTVSPVDETTSSPAWTPVSTSSAIAETTTSPASAPETTIAEPSSSVVSSSPETTSSVELWNPQSPSTDVVPSQTLTTLTTTIGSSTATLTFSTATVFSATTLSTIVISSTASTAATSTSSPTSTYQDCSSLSGKSKAQCLNSNFDNGLYSGSSDSCSIEGETACSANGEFAICNFGKWVNMQCGSGATCYAYSVGDDVDVGCNYSDQKSSFVKRDTTSFITDLFKRSVISHRHHAH